MPVRVLLSVLFLGLAMVARAEPADAGTAPSPQAAALPEPETPEATDASAATETSAETTPSETDVSAPDSVVSEASNALPASTEPPVATTAVAPMPPLPEEEEPTRTRLKVAATHGNYRLLFWNQSDIPLGIRGPGAPVETLGMTNFVEHRLRAGTSLNYGAWQFDFELDVLNGLINAPSDGVLPAIAGPETGAPRPSTADPQRNLAYGLNFNSLAVRQAMATYSTSVGKFALGATTFGWGQGMLSNNGAGRKDALGREVLDAEFGDRRYGDRSIRAYYATRPLSLFSGGRITENFTAIIGADLVLQDETAKLIRPTHDEHRVNADAGFFERNIQDQSYQAVLALRHERGGYSSGLFATRRWLFFPTKRLQDANVTRPFSTDLQVWALDLSVDYRTTVAEGVSVYAGVEGALVTGSTNYVRNASCPGNTDESRCDVLQQGGLARAGISAFGLTLDLLGGYASGDGNPFDANVTNFRMDRDFKVGLILFDQVLAWQSAAQVRRAADPTVTNEPSAGLELLSTAGAVSNAFFINPTLRYEPIDGLNLMGGFVWGLAPERYTDAFWVNVTSDKTNLFGVPAGRNYGYEFDLGASYTREIAKGIALNLGVQAGYFLPGDAFAVDEAGTRMDPVYLAKVRTAVVF